MARYKEKRKERKRARKNAQRRRFVPLDETTCIALANLAKARGRMTP